LLSLQCTQFPLRPLLPLLVLLVLLSRFHVFLSCSVIFDLLLLLLLFF